MNDNINEMAKKYKEEMMRLYSRSAYSNQHKPAVQSAPKPTVRKSGSIPEKTVASASAEQVKQTSAAPPPFTAANKNKKENSSKFESPDAILARELESVDAVPAMADISDMPQFDPNENSSGRLPENTPDDEHEQGNYDFSPNENSPADEDFQVLYDESEPKSAAPMTAKGYLEVEVTAANSAIPIPKATVIVTQQRGDENLLIKMLTTNMNGDTETIELPAPDIAYSESPDPDAKPFAEYRISVAARGFYTVPEITVPIFAGVKSIQPITMIPLAKYQAEGSFFPAAADH